MMRNEKVRSRWPARLLCWIRGQHQLKEWTEHAPLANDLRHLEYRCASCGKEFEAIVTPNKRPISGEAILVAWKSKAPARQTPEGNPK